MSGDAGGGHEAPRGAGRSRASNVGPGDAAVAAAAPPFGPGSLREPCGKRAARGPPPASATTAHLHPMAFTIWRDLSLPRVRAVLPPALRKRAGLLRGDGPFALIVFRGHEVISSREAAKALARLPEPDPVIAARVLAERDFHWTDASYARIRQS